MSLFDTIKEQRAAAFKAGDKFLHSVLTNVFSDASPVGTAADQKPADADVIAIIKKHLKGVVETLGIIKDKAEADVIALKNREQQILESLLPQQLSENALHAIFNDLLPSALKDFMAHLKTEFAGLYDGKLAKKVFEDARAEQVKAAEENAPVADAAPSSSEPA